MGNFGQNVFCKILCIGILSLASCSVTKHLPEGEALYVEGNVVIQTDTIPNQYIKPLRESLEELLRPQPNKTFLGLRPQVWLYQNISPTSKKNSIKGWLKYKVGKEPVLLSDVNREYNQNLLRNRLENLGFFEAEVLSDTTIENKKATVNYTAIPGIIYRIRSVDFETDSSELGWDIQSMYGESLLQEGRPFNLDNIIAERDRIDNNLKNRGYYYFSPDHLLVEVDSSGQNHQVELYLTVKPETPLKALQPYRINQVFIYPDYRGTGANLSSSASNRRLLRDAEPYGDTYFFIDPDRSFRRFALARTMFFKKGDYYNRASHQRTLNQLVNMGTFRFVKNEFVEVDTGENLLDVHYFLTPMPKRGLRIEVLGKTASVYNGMELNVNWLNRNTFRSGELLTVTAFGGFETQTGGNVNLNSSFRRYGAEIALSIPRLIAPFNWEPSRQFVPRTFVRSGYEFLNRKTAYSLNSLRFSTGYQWRETQKKDHELSLLEIAYVQPRNISDTYRAQMDSLPALKHTVEPQFTFGPTYKFTFTNTMEQSRTHTYYFRGGLDLSANLYGLIIGANYKTGEVHQIFDANFSQYLKVEGDFRHYMKLGVHSSLASRIMGGLGYSYGNSSALPYVKQFFVGGPNSIKAFRARALGPGSHIPESFGEDNFFADQTGDVKIELNTEFRSRLASLVHWAAFVDAGNIWLQHADPNKPNAHFTKDFWKEFAVGAGLGLRFDLSFLLLRTDLALPMRVPYRPKGDRWVVDKMNFGDKNWRRDNLVFNLAIGYPF